MSFNQKDGDFKFFLGSLMAIRLTNKRLILFFMVRFPAIIINPLRPGVKLQILLLCFHTLVTEVVGRSC